MHLNTKRNLRYVFGIIGVALFSFGGGILFTTLSEQFAFNYSLTDFQRDLAFTLGFALLSGGLVLMSNFRKPLVNSATKNAFEILIGFLSLVFGGQIFLNEINAIFYYYYKTDHALNSLTAIDVWSWSVIAFLFLGLGIWLILKGKE